MSTLSVATTGTQPISWNGPICAQCGARYIGSHVCTAEDLTRRIHELLALLPMAVRMGDVSRKDFGQMGTDAMQDRTAGCPCRPENGSGVCGCTLGGPQVTC